MGALLRLHARVLGFVATGTELLGLDRRHLAWGLFCTWIVGVGRWWDDPGARLVQHLGLGSILYVFALSGLVWLLGWPLRPENWSYFRVLTFISLCSAPGMIYAIPVERWYGVHHATLLNVWFLGIVAVWRLALLGSFFARTTKLPTTAAVVATILPIMLIVAALTALNLERAVFEVMARVPRHTAADGAYLILLIITALSVYGSVLVVPWYLIECFLAWRARRKGEAGEQR
jgi:hypothetical protein